MTWSTYFGGTGLEETVDARSEGQIIVNPNLHDQVYISGYTLIPALSYQAAIDKKSIIRFEEPQPVREIGIVTHKNFTRERLIDELRKSILLHTPDEFRKNTMFVMVEWR